MRAGAGGRWASFEPIGFAFQDGRQPHGQCHRRNKGLSGPAFLRESVLPRDFALPRHHQVTRLVPALPRALKRFMSATLMWTPAACLSWFREAIRLPKGLTPVPEDGPDRRADLFIGQDLIRQRRRGSRWRPPPVCRRGAVSMAG